MSLYSDLIAKYQSGQSIVLGILGDSTSMGFGANPEPGGATWNGLVYGALNTNWSPNWSIESGWEDVCMGSEGLITYASAHDYRIPGTWQLMEQHIQLKNASSRVANYAGSGWTAGTAIGNGVVASVLAENPDAVFVNFGLNSVKNKQYSDHAANVRSICTSIVNAGVLCVLVKENNAYSIETFTSPPASWAQMVGGAYAAYPWKSYVDLMDTIQGEHTAGAVMVVDLYSPTSIGGDANNAADKSLLYDCFHLNAAGYQVIANTYAVFLGDVSANITSSNVSVTSSGGICIGGSSQTSSITVPNNTQVISTGGIVFGGSSLVQSGVQIWGSGGFIADGPGILTIVLWDGTSTQLKTF
jgi:lysophospholipase L1-like esterase